MPVFSPATSRSIRAHALLLFATFALVAPAFASGILGSEFTGKSDDKSGKKGTAVQSTEATPIISSTTTAPPYSVSGRWPELQHKIIAQTPYGPINALDLLMYDGMNAKTLQGTPVDNIIHADTAPNAPTLAALKVVTEQLTAANKLAAQAADWQPPADEVRTLTYGPAICAYNQLYVQPQVVVDAADVDHYYLSHPEKYLGRRRVQVRYIFIPVDPKVAGQLQTATDQLNKLSLDVLNGRRPFADAARELSKAPSAGKGGEIPPFYNGTFFQAFEDQAFSLIKPGELSAVFSGPDGMYIQQLIQTWAPANISINSVTPEITTFLSADHIKFYYQHDLENLQKDIYSTNNSNYWAYLDLDTPIAQCGTNRLEREEILRYYANPTDAEFNVNFGLVVGSATAWLEGEAIMQTLETRKQANHPYVVRGREIAELTLRSKHALRGQIPTTGAVPIAAAAATLAKKQDFVKGLRMVRLVGFQISPKTKLTSSPGEINDAQHAADTLVQQLTAGTLPAATPLTLSDWWKRSQRLNDEPTDDALEELKTAARSLEFPNVSVKFIDQGWQPAIPNSSWGILLANTQPGQLSPQQKIPPNTTVYLIIGQKPLDLDLFKTKPLYLQNLAYNAALLDTLNKDIADVRPGIKYQF